MALLDVEVGFWSIRRQMEGLIGSRLTNSVLQQAGANGGASFAKSFGTAKDEVEQKEFFNSCLQAYQTAGFGQFEIERIDWPIGHVIIRAKDAFEAWMVSQHDQKVDSSVCAYTAGVLVGFVNVICNRRDVVCVEHHCQAMGDSYCEFELLPASEAGEHTMVAFTPDPKLGRQLNMLEMLFERMPMGIAILDHEYHIQRYNSTWGDFSKLYAPPSGAPLTPGVNYFDHLPGSESIAIPLFERVLAGETIRQNALKFESGGIVSFWDVVLAPLVENGEVRGILNVTIDATERMMLRQNLEQHVKERTHELSTLLKMSRDLASTLELEPLLGLVLDQLKRVVDYNGSTILTMEGDDLIVRAYRGPIPQEEAMRLSFDKEHSLVNHEVIRRREPIIIPDVKDDTPLAQAFQESAGEQMESTFGHIRTWMGVPLMVKDQVIGMLALDHHEMNYYSPRQAELVFALANRAAAAIENARLHQLEQSRKYELQILLDVAETANSSLNLDEVLTKTLDLVVDLVGASRAGVILLDENTGDLLPHTLRPEQTIEQDDMAKIVQACQAVIASDETLYVAPDIDKGLLEPGALLPLHVRGKVMGVLVIIGSQGREFNQGQLILFKSIADQLGVALENAQLYKQAQELAVVEERSRLARDLHDAVTQTLFSTSLIAEVLPDIWEKDPEEGKQLLKEVRQLSRGALTEMRALLLELRPAALAEAKLGVLLRQLAEAASGRTGMPITVSIVGECEIPPDVHVAVYRIAQEALNNIVKHAHAGQAEIKLHCRKTNVDGKKNIMELYIHDDGRGFDADCMSPDHMGLRIMRERTETIGAKLEIVSEPDLGTQITVIWKEARNKGGLPKKKGGNDE